MNREWTWTSDADTNSQCPYTMRISLLEPLIPPKNRRVPGSAGKVPPYIGTEPQAEADEHCWLSPFLLHHIPPISHIPKTPSSSRKLTALNIISANANVLCDSETDWYHALSNVSTCPGNAGYFYDASRQLAWGFTTYWDINFCDNVAWVGIYN